jgi:hypothetical protein
MQACIGSARTALGEPAFEDAWATGRTWALDEAIDRLLLATTGALTVTV